MMSLKEIIEQDMRNALKKADKLSLSVLRMMLSEIKNERIKKGAELFDTEVLSLLARQVKIRRQSILEFEKAQRTDLAERERQEIDVIKRYLPETLADEAIIEIVNEVIKNLEATSLQDMGKVMGQVMAKVQGKAEGQKVSALVKARLSSL